MRTHAFEQGDIHVFCREEDIPGEVARFIGSDYAVALSTRPTSRANSDELWEWAEALLGDAARLTLRFEPRPCQSEFGLSRAISALRSAPLTGVDRFYARIAPGKLPLTFSNIAGLAAEWTTARLRESWRILGHREPRGLAYYKGIGLGTNPGYIVEGCQRYAKQ